MDMSGSLTPELSPAPAESYTTPVERGGKSRARLSSVIHPPTHSLQHD